MKREQILETIADLAKTQGFYGRLLVNLANLKSNDPEKYEKTMCELEAKNFKSELELIMYLEA
jgi:hypothetical protein